MTKFLNFIKKTYKLLLYIIVLLAPIYRLVPSLPILNISIFSLVLVAFFLVTFLNILLFKFEAKRFIISLIFFSALLTSFIYSVLVYKSVNSGMFILLMFLFSILFCPDYLENRDKDNVVLSFFASSWFSGIFSVYYGFLKNGGVKRTGGIIDGSLCIVVLCLILFYEFKNYNKKMINVLRFLSFFSSLIILGFGMSRTRIVIFFLLILLKGMQKVLSFNLLSTINVNKFYIGLFSFVGIIFVCMIFSNQISQLLYVIGTRFDEGTVDLTRNIEINYGLNLFRKNYFLGSGWGDFYYIDQYNSEVLYNNHCFYVAILARGGLLSFLCFCIYILYLLVDSIKEKNRINYILITCVLLLSLANAGLFNYTICLFMFLIILFLKEKTSSQNLQLS